MGAMNYDSIKERVPDFFCVRNLRDIYKNSSYNFEMSFVDFLMCIEDYYTFIYSTKLSRTAWLLFTWLRTLVRYDGFVKLSYKDVSNKFCEKKSVISKPTFFKCINELDEFGLIKKFSNKKLFDFKYQKDVNTYIVISKIDDILPLMDGLRNQLEFYNILRQNYFTNNNAKKKEEKPKDKIQVAENKTLYTYEYVMEEYKLVETELLDFFKFLGSNNKSKDIAKSRKTNILNFIMEVYPYEDDLVYAISQTIAKGVRSEKYLYAILKNICGVQEQGKTEENSTQKELKDKYKQKTKSFYDNTEHMSYEEYQKAKETILTKERGYVSILKELKKLSNMNNYESKLYKTCDKLNKKFELHKSYECYRGKRINILSELNISEWVEYDSCWNEIIHWTYGDDENENIVPFKEMQEIANKHKDAFIFNDVQYINERMY